MKLKELLYYLESEVPPAYQESYDNSGIQVGNPDETVGSALLCLDVTEEVLEEAVDQGHRLIISHHPLIFGPLRSISGATPVERIIKTAILRGIAIYSMHTNLDMIGGGVSHRMAMKMGLKDIEPLVGLEKRLMKLVVFVPVDHAQRVRDAIFDAGAGNIGNYDRCSYNIRGEGTFRGGADTDPYAGEPGKEHTEKETRIETVVPAHLASRVVRAMKDAHPYEEVAYDLYSLENTVPGSGLGCTGKTDKTMNEEELLRLLGETFEVKCMRHSPIRGKEIKKIALVGGSGGSYVKNAIAASADAYITADIKYHAFFEADDRIFLVDIGHYESEKPALEIIHELITKKFPKFAVRFSEINTNPVNYSQPW